MLRSFDVLLYVSLSKLVNKSRLTGNLWLHDDHVKSILWRMGLYLSEHILLYYVPWNKRTILCFAFVAISLLLSGFTWYIYQHSSGLHNWHYGSLNAIEEHSEQKCAHFCSEWSIVGYGTDAFWDLWIWSIEIIKVLQVNDDRCPCKRIVAFVYSRASVMKCEND